MGVQLRVASDFQSDELGIGVAGFGVDARVSTVGRLA